MFKDRSSAISWDGHEAKAVIAVRALRRQGPTFGEVAREWWALVEAGTYARRRGRGKPLSATTVADYRAVLLGGPERRGQESRTSSLVLIDRCGERPIAALDDAYWQSLVDELVGDGKSYSLVVACAREVAGSCMRSATKTPIERGSVTRRDGQGVKRGNGSGS